MSSTCRNLSLLPKRAEEARRFLHAAPENQIPLAVIADEQGKGRGTNERAWESRKGNLVLTICIPMNTVRFVDGATTPDRCHGCPKARAPVSVKWPNVILLENRKLAAILIESEIVGPTTWLLIGLGINAMASPNLQGSPGKEIRAATNSL